MEDIGVELTEDEFFKAGKRLIKYISQDQKALLINSHSNCTANDSFNQITGCILNDKSEGMVKENSFYKDFDIYTRGQIRKKSVQNNIEKGRTTHFIFLGV